MHCGTCGRKLRSKRFKNCPACRHKHRAVMKEWITDNHDRWRQINGAATRKYYWKDIEASRARGREKMRRLYAENPEHYREASRVWKNKHRDEVQARRREARKTEEYKVASAAYKKDRYRSDLATAISYMVRARMAKVFKSAGITRRSPTSFGISYTDIAKHVGPRPENSDLHHIVPLSQNRDWDFNDPVHVLAAFGPMNCEWRTSEEHKKLKDAPTDMELRERLLAWARGAVPH